LLLKGYGLKAPRQAMIGQGHLLSANGHEEVIFKPWRKFSGVKKEHKMKVNFNIFLAVVMVFALALGACSPAAQPQTAAQAPLKVLAVETFLADIAQNVAGERVKVESLIPLGMDPHVFEPTPQDVRKIAESNVLILNGAGFEEWIEKTLENAGGERLVVEASAGLTMREPGENEPGHEHAHEHEKEGEEHDDHSVESHSKMVCEQLEGKQAEEEIQAGANANSAAKLHHEGEHAEGEHGHEREIITINLIRQDDGTYAGFVIFEAEAEEGYAFTSVAGNIRIADANGAAIEAIQELDIECSGMTQGFVYKLTPGEYIVELSKFASESVLFSAAPVHAHDHEGEEHAHKDEHQHSGEEHSHAHEHHHEGDPHFWLDPNNVIKYVENIRDGLIAADPQGKEIYTQNAAAYIAKLSELDAWIKTQVEQIPPERRLIVTNHESFGYFADRYGFKIIGTIVPSVSTNASPSAQQLARLVDHIKETGAIAIFLETGSSPQLAEQIAAETGVKVVSELYTHSITEPGGKAPSYIDMMKYNVTAIVEALK
jgi:ABC-type Zn uptake system ZnuABC Zn-binding protein ZnuA